MGNVLLSLLKCVLQLLLGAQLEGAWLDVQHVAVFCHFGVPAAPCTQQGLSAGTITPEHCN